MYKIFALTSSQIGQFKITTKKTFHLNTFQIITDSLHFNLIFIVAF